MSKNYAAKLDKRRKTLLKDPLLIGSLVMVRDHRWIEKPFARPKLESIYYPSKYRVIDNNHGIYTVESVDDGQKLGRRVTLDMMKRISGPTIIEQANKRTNSRRNVITEPEDDDSYALGERLDMEQDEGDLYYNIKWNGYTEPT